MYLESNDALKIGSSFYGTGMDVRVCRNGTFVVEEEMEVVLPYVHTFGEALEHPPEFHRQVIKE